MLSVAVHIKEVCGLPDHELVVTAARGVVGVSSSEDIVGDVRTDIPGLVVPLNVGGHALDVANLKALCELPTDIRIALDIVLTTLPCPAGGP